MRQALGPGALGGPGGSGWRGRWEGGSGWGRHVNSGTFHLKKKKILDIAPSKKIINKKIKDGFLYQYAECSMCGFSR